MLWSHTSPRRPSSTTTASITAVTTTNSASSWKATMSGQTNPSSFWCLMPKAGCLITPPRSGTIVSTGTVWAEVEVEIQPGRQRRSLRNNLAHLTNSKQLSPTPEWPTSARDVLGLSNAPTENWRSGTPMTLELLMLMPVALVSWVLTSGSTPTTLTTGMVVGTTLLRFGSWWIGIS